MLLKVCWGWGTLPSAALLFVCLPGTAPWAALPLADLLRTLKERSEANRGARKKALEDKYCMRQVGAAGQTRLQAN